MPPSHKDVVQKLCDTMHSMKCVQADEEVCQKEQGLLVTKQMCGKDHCTLKCKAMSTQESRNFTMEPIASVGKAQPVPHSADNQMPNLFRTPLLFSCAHMMTPHQLPMTVTSQAAHNRHQDDEGQGGMSQADMRIYQLTKIMMEEERDMHNMVRMEHEGTNETLSHSQLSCQ